MSIKRFFFNLFFGALIYGFTGFVYDSVVMPEDIIYVLSIYGMFGVSLVAHGYILSFLTVRKVFLTRLVTVASLFYASYIVAETIIPVFKVVNISTSGMSGKLISINDYTLDKYMTIGVLSIVGALVYCIMSQLGGINKES